VFVKVVVNETGDCDISQVIVVCDPDAVDLARDHRGHFLVYDSSPRSMTTKHWTGSAVRSRWPRTGGAGPTTDSSTRTTAGSPDPTRGRSARPSTTTSKKRASGKTRMTDRPPVFGAEALRRLAAMRDQRRFPLLNAWEAETISDLLCRLADHHPGEDLGAFAMELAVTLRTRLEDLGDLGHEPR
jgi:hypothetical protein